MNDNMMILVFIDMYNCEIHMNEMNYYNLFNFTVLPTEFNKRILMVVA